MAAAFEKQSKRILLVEGDELVRTAMASFLEAKECVLKACRTAREGIEALEREDFDLIFCDLTLPNTECAEFLRFSGACCPTARRVLMTGPKETFVSADLRELGVDAVIEKPLTPASVEDCLVQMTRSR